MGVAWLVPGLCRMPGIKLPPTPAVFSALYTSSERLHGPGIEPRAVLPLVTSSLYDQFFSLQAEQPHKQWSYKGFIQGIKVSTLVSLVHDVVDAALRKLWLNEGCLWDWPWPSGYVSSQCPCIRASCQLKGERGLCQNLKKKTLDLCWLVMSLLTRFPTHTLCASSLEVSAHGTSKDICAPVVD